MKETKGLQATMVPLEKISPDPNQPRKTFNVDRLADLMRSIDDHGIISPLVIEQRGDGYILIDGERRYRAAKELKLTEVPAVVRSAMSDTERIIEQFHLQEQHEGWSATEKAVAVARLASELKLDVTAVAKLLRLPERTLRTYISFAGLLERKEFAKADISLNYANGIMALRRLAKRVWADKLKEDFTQDMERDLELAIISRVKRGEITKPAELRKVADSLNTDPAKITKFIRDEKMTVQKLFIDSEAEVAYHYRNLIYAAYSLSSHIDRGIPLKVRELIEDRAADVKALRNAERAIVELIGSK